MFYTSGLVLVYIFLSSGQCQTVYFSLQDSVSLYISLFRTVLVYIFLSSGQCQYVYFFLQESAQSEYSRDRTVLKYISSLFRTVISQNLHHNLFQYNYSQPQVNLSAVLKLCSIFSNGVLEGFLTFKRLLFENSCYSNFVHAHSLKFDPFADLFWLSALHNAHEHI